MPASRHRAARGLRRRCAMPGVARGHATILNIHRTGVLSTLQRHIDIHISYIFMSAWLPGYLVTLTLPRSADASRRLDDHDGYITTTTAIYIILGCVFRIFCSLHLPPAATCARAPAATWTGTPRTAIASNPAERERKSGFQAADGGHHAGARRRRTAASSGRPTARHEATKPPPRAHLANKLGSLQRAPCFSSSSSSLPRRLSADGGAKRPFHRPRHTPKRGCTSARELQASSARLGSCRRWYCTGRWHCSPLALH
jgi:hypothetical protein